MKRKPDPSLFLLLPLVSKPNCEVVSGNGNATKIPFSSRFSGSIMRSIWDVRWLNNEKRKRKKNCIFVVSIYLFFFNCVVLIPFFSSWTFSVTNLWALFQKFRWLIQFSATKKMHFYGWIKSLELVILRNNPNIRFFLRRKGLFG